MSGAKEEWPVYYHGRHWDAPFTDGAIEVPLLVESEKCDICEELMIDSDDVVLLRYMQTHLECHLRSALGSVQHLEGRCGSYCGGEFKQHLPSDDYATHREGAKATLQWLLDHGRGRFHD